jgi:hypothetical protein
MGKLRAVLLYLYDKNTKNTRNNTKIYEIICIYQKFFVSLHQIVKNKPIKGGGNTIKTATKL